MKKDFAHAKLTERLLGAAIAVHKELGPGFLEKIYERALCIELDRERIPYQQQVRIPIFYRAKICGFHQLDLVIDSTVIIELKAAKNFQDVHFATILSYLKASNMPVALLLNYAAPTLAIRRFGQQNIFNGESRRQGSGEDVIKTLQHEPI
jgi:GxxExxY protein